MDAGDPGYGAYFPGFTGDRALPGPSPSANLVGIFGRATGRKRDRCFPAVFLFSPVPAPLRRRTYAAQTKSPMKPLNYALSLNQIKVVLIVLLTI